MNNTEISCLVLSSPFRNLFRGIITPAYTDILLDGYYIGYTEEDNSPSGHWVAFVIDDAQEHVFFFDSFGLPPFDYYTLLKPYSLWYNPKTLQSLTSELCGLYCIGFL